MGLGLIALGFALLDGFIMLVNEMKLFPEYIAYGMLLIGLLVIRRKIRIKALDVAFVLGTMILIYHMIPIVLNDVLILEIIVRLLFYSSLFYGISKIIKDHKVEQLMMTFVIVYAIMSLLIFISIEDSSLLIIEGVLLIVKAILCLIIAYCLLKHNRLLVEHYENIKVVTIKHIPRLVLVTLMIISFGILIVLQEPFVQNLYNASKESYIWYGEIKDKVIVDRMSLEREFYFDHTGTSLRWPVVWVNDQQFDQAVYYSCDLSVDDQQQIKSSSYTMIDKEIIDIYGIRQGYQPIGIYLEESFDFDHCQESLSLDFSLYNNNYQEIQTYHVPLYDRKQRLTSYHYKDETIEVSDLQVDQDYIIQTPYIKIKDDTLRSYQLYLSSSQSLENAVNIQYFDVDTNKQGNIYYAKYVDDYLPHDNYYLLIVDNDLQIVKIVRLEQ